MTPTSSSAHIKYERNTLGTPQQQHGNTVLLRLWYKTELLQSIRFRTQCRRSRTEGGTSDGSDGKIQKRVRIGKYTLCVD